MFTTAHSKIETDIKQYIDEYICKGIFKKKIGNRILVAVQKPSQTIEKVESTLLETGYNVTITDNIYADPDLFREYGLAYVDCSLNYQLLDHVIKLREPEMPVVAIMEDSVGKKEHVFKRDAYDYITTSISSIELINKTNLYLLYSAACSLNIFDEATQNLDMATSKDHELLDTTCHYFLNNMSDYDSIDNLCRLVGTNRNTLAKIFKKRFGMGPYAWLRQMRIERASELLKATDLSIQSICFEVGYENAANFSTTFKSITGITPKAYRKLHNQNFK